MENIIKVAIEGGYEWQGRSKMYPVRINSYGLACIDSNDGNKYELRHQQVICDPCSGRA